MKSIKILMIGLITALSISVGHAEPPKTNPCELATVTTQQVDKKVLLVSAYTSQIGVREATGKNDGVQVEKYLKNVGLSKGYAWCTAFVRWCFDMVGIQTTITAWSPSAHNPKNVVYLKGRFYKVPDQGDVGTLWYARLKRIGHGFFYDKPINTSIYESVEGNTNEAGSREGDGVYRKKRSYNATYSISRWL